MAWLNVAPQGSEQSRQEEFEKGGFGSPFLVLPPINDAEYIVDLWHEAGTVESTGMGLSRLSWREIESWLNIRNKYEPDTPTLLGWEINLVKQMSQAYSAEYSQASAKDCPAPYSLDNLNDMDREAVGSKLSSVLGNFGKAASERKYEIEE